MQYKDLNLNKLRDDNGLDFAHYTYLKDMCTCCYGPFDFPKRFWRNSEKPTKVKDANGFHYEINEKVLNENDIQYILFQNAENGIGNVKDTDEIRDYQSIAWQFPMEKMKRICQDLQEQFGDEYVVAMPTDEFTCIMICAVNYPGLEEKIKSQGYINIREV